MKKYNLLVGVLLTIIILTFCFLLNLIFEPFSFTTYYHGEEEFDGYTGYANYIHYDDISLEDEEVILEALNKSKNISIIEMLNGSNGDSIVNFKYNTSDLTENELNNFNIHFTFKKETPSCISIHFYSPNPVMAREIPNNESDEFWEMANSQMSKDREILNIYKGSLISHLESILNITPSEESRQIIH